MEQRFSTIARERSSNNVVRLIDIFDPQDWHKEANCRDEDDALFIYVYESELSQEQFEERNRICGECTVREACIEYAVETVPPYGYWGANIKEIKKTARKLGNKPQYRPKFRGRKPKAS